MNMLKFILTLSITITTLFGETINSENFRRAVEDNNIKKIKKLLDAHQKKDGNYLSSYAFHTLNSDRKVDIELFEYIEKKGHFDINRRNGYFAYTILHSSLGFYYVDMDFIKYLINREDIDKSMRSSFVRILDYFNYNIIIFRYNTIRLSEHSFTKYWHTSWNTPLQRARVMLEVVEKRKEKGTTQSMAYEYDICLPLSKRVRTIDDDISDLREIIKVFEL